MAVVGRLSQNHAVICISHRLANVVGADVVYAIDRGSVVGRGTHEQLLERCDTYSKLWEQQSELEAFRVASIDGQTTKGGERA